MIDDSLWFVLQSEAEVTLYQFLTTGLRWAWAIVAGLFLMTALYLNTSYPDRNYNICEWGPFFIIGSAILLLTTGEFWFTAAWVLIAIELFTLFVVSSVYTVMLINVLWPKRQINLKLLFSRP